MKYNKIKLHRLDGDTDVDVMILKEYPKENFIIDKKYISKPLIYSLIGKKVRVKYDDKSIGVRTLLVKESQVQFKDERTISDKRITEIELMNPTEKDVKAVLYNKDGIPLYCVIKTFVCSRQLLAGNTRVFIARSLDGLVTITASGIYSGTPVVDELDFKRIINQIDGHDIVTLTTQDAIARRMSDAIKVAQSPDWKRCERLLNEVFGKHGSWKSWREVDKEYSAKIQSHNK
ncbi:MAG: hypothetical protein C4567_05630 [Deltaproteobacteria bacterium]|nr:MAG: hypothetical protein C4567_05630 [Deltaproteobacteria bacterium]